MRLLGGSAPPASVGVMRGEGHFRTAAASMFLSSQSPRDNTIYSWNSHSSGVNERRAAVHGESRRIPNRNWQQFWDQFFPSYVRGGQGPPQPFGQDAATFWRMKIAVWESIRLDSSWRMLVGQEAGSPPGFPSHTRDVALPEPGRLSPLDPSVPLSRAGARIRQSRRPASL